MKTTPSLTQHLSQLIDKLLDTEQKESEDSKCGESWERWYRDG